MSLIYHLQSGREQDISYSFSHCSNHQAVQQVTERKKIHYKYLKYTYTKWKEGLLPTLTNHRHSIPSVKMHAWDTSAQGTGKSLSVINRTCTPGWRWWHTMPYSSSQHLDVLHSSDGGNTAKRSRTRERAGPERGRRERCHPTAAEPVENRDGCHIRHDTAIAGDLSQGPDVWGLCNKAVLRVYLENKLFCGFCIFLKYKQEIFSTTFSPLYIPLEAAFCT